MKSLNRVFFLTMSLFMFSLSAQQYSQEKGKYWALRSVDLSTLGRKQAALVHEQMTRVLLRIEAQEKYEEYGQGSSLSLRSLLNGLSDALVTQCIADEGAEMCLFGGWPSYRKNGSCKTPYGSVGSSASSDLGTKSYNSDVYCQDKGLFRCNPLVFGPGIKPDLIPSGLGNVNGNGNKNEPYHAGICVDISGGFNGLSEKCANASKKLDEVRKEKGMPAWRESDFFDADKAAHLRALQEVIVQKCEANSERLNKDGMCTALEKNLALTATAAKLQKLNGIKLEEVFPQCAPSEKDNGVKCEPSNNETLANLQAALSSLKEDQECQFDGVHAWDSSDYSDALSIPECSTSIVGTLSNGFGEEGDKDVTVYLKTKDAAYAPIQLSMNKSMSPAQIIEKIKESEDFSNACKNSGVASCNIEHERNSAKGRLAMAISRLKTMQGYKTDENGNKTGRVDCKLTHVGAELGDSSSEGPLKSENAAIPKGSSQCSEYMSDDLAAAFSKPEYRNTAIPVVLKLQKEGTVFSVPVKVDSAGSIKYQELVKSVMDSQGYNEFCAGEASETADTLAERKRREEERRKGLRSNLGLAENQFLTPEMEESLLKASEIEGLKVSIDQEGNISFEHDSLGSVSDQIEEAFGSSLVNGKIRANDMTKATFLTRGKGMEISDDEIKSLAGIGEKTALESVSRDGAGNIVFTVKSGYRRSLDNNNRIRELESRAGGRYIIQPVLDETGGEFADRRMVLRPVTVKRATGAILDPHPKTVERATGALLSPVTSDDGIDPRLHRNIKASSDLVTEQIRRALRGERGSEENFSVTVGDPSLTENGETEVFINFYMSTMVIAQKNRYYNEMRLEARRQGCRLDPEKPTEFEGTLQFICP